MITAPVVDDIEASLWEDVDVEAEPDQAPAVDGAIADDPSDSSDSDSSSSSSSAASKVVERRASQHGASTGASAAAGAAASARRIRALSLDLDANDAAPAPKVDDNADSEADCLEVEDSLRQMIESVYTTGVIRKNGRQNRK